MNRIDPWLATNTAPYIVTTWEDRYLGSINSFSHFLDYYFLIIFLLVTIPLQARSGLRLVEIFLLETADGQGGLPTQHLAGR